MRTIVVNLALAAGAVLSAVALATPPSPPADAHGRDGSRHVAARREHEAREPRTGEAEDQGGRSSWSHRESSPSPGPRSGGTSHPGENVNVVLQGTLTLYHDEDCANGVAYPAGSAFPTHPDQVHLARDLSETETLIFFATYFAPKTTPPTAVRVDEPLPAPGCPQ
jgi:quercetin dioxygenase-like cupin family protein